MSESLDGVSVSTSFAQSRLVSVSTSIDFPSLDESRSRHPRNLSVSMSLGLDIHKISKSCWVIKQRKAKQKESNQTRYNQSKSIHLLDWVCFLQHQILTFDGWVSPVREKKSRPTNQKTRIISEISMSLDGVSVSTFFAQLRLRFFQSRSRSRYWDLAFSVSVSVSSLRLRPFQSRSRSRYWDSDIFSLGLGLDDPNLVSLIPDSSLVNLSWKKKFGSVTFDITS